MGNLGAAIGGSLGIIDEVLSLYNKTDNYYGTSALEIAAITNLFIPHAPRITALLPNNLGVFRTVPISIFTTLNQPIWKSSTIFLAAAINVGYNYHGEHEPKEKWAALKIKEDLHELYSDIIPKNQLDDLIHKQTVALVTNQLIIAKLSLSLAGYDQQLDKYFATLSTGKKSWQNFFIAHKTIAFFIPPFVMSHMNNNFMSAYLNTKVRYITHNKFNDKYYQGETALHLAQNSSSSNVSSNVLVKKKDDDISVIVNDGGNLITEGFSAAIQGGYNIIYLCTNNAEDIIMYSSFYNQVTNGISSNLAIMASDSNTKIEDINAKLTSIEAYGQEHALEMTQTNANEFIKSQMNELITELRTLRENSLIWRTIDNCWKTSKSISDSLYNYMVVANKIHQGELKSNQGAQIIAAAEPISELFGWHASKAGEIITLDQSKERLTELNKRMEEVNLESDHRVAYSFEQSEQPAICFHNLKIGVQDNSRFHLDDLCISGKRTAIIAKSGGGKSTFLTIVKDITRSEAWGEGEITYYTKTGEAPKIIMTQRQYIPPYNSLLELITFKRGDQAKLLEARAIELLEEIRINSDEDKAGAKDLISRLNNRENWKDILSDGQIQKIAAIRVILENPDIAILDELLKGLDSHSVQIVEAMLISHLPSTLFLVVDHHAQANNYNNFYDNTMYFANGTAVIKAMDSSYETIVEYTAPLFSGNITDQLTQQDDS